MPIIHFAKNRAPLEVGENANLMEALLSAHIPVASSCLGDGICGRCRVQILKGKEHLSKVEAQEEILRDRLNIKADTRISCQTRVRGDVTIDTTYW